MAAIGNIVDQINVNMRDNQFSSKKFTKGQIWGLCELIRSEDVDTPQTKPLIISNNGNDRYVGIDDTYPFQIYHRIITEEVEPDEENDFGNLIFRKEIANMKMVVIGDRSRLKMTKDQLVTGVLLGMNLQFAKSFQTANSLASANVNIGAFNLIQDAVYQEEWTEKVKLSTNSILFSLNYQIETETYTPCISVC